jgi:putative N6-adenine-specific DNA methylase
MSDLELFVTCSQLLEPILANELKELGFEGIQLGYRGVSVPFRSMEDIYKINYCSRIAGRVLLPIKRFRCSGTRDLYHFASKIDWRKLMSLDTTFAIDANVTHRELRNSLYAAQIVKDALCDQFMEATGKRPSVDTKNPKVQINLFIRDQTGIISLDTSGQPLHKRGYRIESGEAPIQENLAAALIDIAQYNGNEILLDPCCGSGTILIEAALKATKTPPGFLRREWGFAQMPEYKVEEWLKVKNEADKNKKPLSSDKIFGCDKSKDSIRICKSNLKAAGFPQVEVIQYDFRDFTPRILPNLIITNPPHGIRLETTDPLRTLYRALGDFMKNRTQKPARGFVFTGNMELTKEVGLASKRRHEMSSGGVECRLLEYDIF